MNCHSSIFFFFLTRRINWSNTIFEEFAVDVHLVQRMHVVCRTLCQEPSCHTLTMSGYIIIALKKMFDLRSDFLVFMWKYAIWFSVLAYRYNAVNSKGQKKLIYVLLFVWCVLLHCNLVLSSSCSVLQIKVFTMILRFESDCKRVWNNSKTWSFQMKLIYQCMYVNHNRCISESSILYINCKSYNRNDQISLFTHFFEWLHWLLVNFMHITLHLFFLSCCE